MKFTLKVKAVSVLAIAALGALQAAHAQVDSTGITALRGTPRLEAAAPTPSQGGYDRAWTTQFPGQTRNGWNSSWARINADGSVDAAYSGWLGFTSRIYNPSLGDGAKPIVKASCVSQSSGRGADRITSNHYMALIPEGNAGTGEVTGWTLRVGYDAWAVTNCSGRWRVYDYRANGSVGGPYDI